MQSYCAPITIAPPLSPSPQGLTDLFALIVKVSIPMVCVSRTMVIPPGGLWVILEFSVLGFRNIAPIIDSLGLQHQSVSIQWLFLGLAGLWE